MPYALRTQANPRRLGLTLPRRSKTNIGSVAPKFAHIEMWEKAVVSPWTRLMSIRGQYDELQ
jgi:hypothetical protein